MIYEYSNLIIIKEYKIDNESFYFEFFMKITYIRYEITIIMKMKILFFKKLFDYPFFTINYL